VKQLIYDPKSQGSRMNIVCFVSGSGTNYQRIVERDPNHNYLVFTNRPGCEGSLKAKQYGHPVIELSHAPYFKGTREKYGGTIPRSCPEREKFEKDVCWLIEDKLQKKPDLVCLAGYDLVFTDQTIDRYPWKILNVHPGDTTKGYAGLHWLPTAKAILAGDDEIRSTLFLADKGLDTGPVLVQSRPLKIFTALSRADSGDLHKVISYAKTHSITNYEQFAKTADAERKEIMKRVCERLQNSLKEAGDWEIYPFAVHDLIAKGSVAVDGRRIYVNGKELPVYGYRLDTPV